MKKIFAIMAVMIMFAAGFSGVVYAQEAQDSHAQAAEEFLMAMKTPEQLEEGINSMVDLMLQAQPMMAPYRQTILEFYAKYLSWKSLRDSYVSITKELLSESDLKELTAFFQTDVGQNFIKKQPEMFQRTSELGFNVMQENQQELIDILEAEAAKYTAEEIAAEATE